MQVRQSKRARFRCTRIKSRKTSDEAGTTKKAKGSLWRQDRLNGGSALRLLLCTLHVLESSKSKHTTTIENELELSRGQEEELDDWRNSDPVPPPNMEGWMNGRMNMAESSESGGGLRHPASVKGGALT